MRDVTLTLFLALGLACAGDKVDGDSFTEDQDMDFGDLDLSCDNEGFEFSASVYGDAVSVQVTGWLLDSELGTHALTDRGDGDWIAFVSDAEMGASCVSDVSDMYFLFTATSARGRTAEEGLDP